MTSTVTIDGKNSSGRIFWLLVALFTTQVYVVSSEDPPQPIQQQQSQPQKIPSLFPPPLLPPQSSQLFQQPQQQQQQQSSLPLQQPSQLSLQPSQQQLSPQSQPQQQIPQQLPQQQIPQQLPQPQFQQLPQLSPQPQQQTQSTQQLTQPQFQQLPQTTQQPQSQQQMQSTLPLQQPPQLSLQPQPPQQIQSTLQIPQLPQLSLQPQPQQQMQSTLSIPQPQFQQQSQLQSQSQQKPQKLNDRPNLMEPLNMQIQSSISEISSEKVTPNTDSKLNQPQSQQIQGSAMIQPTNTPQYAMSGGLPQGPSINQQQQDSIPTQGLQGFNLPPMKNDVQYPSFPGINYPQNFKPPRKSKMPYSFDSNPLPTDQKTFSAPQFPIDPSWITSMPQQFASAIPIDAAMTMFNPMPYTQQPMQMATNAVDKLRDYGTGVKNGVGTFALDMGNKLIDVSQSMVNMAAAIPNAVLEQKKKSLNSLAGLLNIPQQSNSAGGSAGNSQYYPQSTSPINSYYSGSYGGQMGGGYQGQMGPGGYAPQMQGGGYGGYQGQFGGAGYPYQMNGAGYGSPMSGAGYGSQMNGPGYSSQMSGGFNGQRSDQFPAYPQQQQQPQQWFGNRNQNFGPSGPINPVDQPQPINRYSSFSSDSNQM